MKSYTCQFQRIRSFEAMKIISTVMISYYLFLYRAVHGVHHTLFFAVYLLHFFHFKWMLINSDLLRTNEWIDSIESITRLIQWICLMRYILSSLTIFSFTNNTVAIHAKQCCLTINLSADRKNINIYAHKPLNKEK